MRVNRWSKSAPGISVEPHDDALDTAAIFRTGTLTE